MVSNTLIKRDYMDFQEGSAYLDSLMMFGVKLGLEQVDELLVSVGSPHLDLKFIHLAGSNGKGSCGAMLNAALRGAGYKVGFYSSPHLISVRERFRINGQAISEDDFAALITRYRPAVEQMKEDLRCPTYFELTTAMAALYFADNEVDYVIWETGMGGRLDATNVIDPLCSVITSISLEHCEYLGETLADIATEKAGIIKPRRPVFTSKLPPEAAEVVKARARELRCTVYNPVKELPDVDLPLVGDYQRKNLALVTAVLQYLEREHGLDLQKAFAGVGQTRWPGRCQILSDDTVVDGAHNPEGAATLAATLEKLSPGQRYTVIFGCLQDKDAAAIIKALAPVADEFIFVPVVGTRPCISPDELVKCAQHFTTVPASKEPFVSLALARPRANPLLVTGSLYLSGDVLGRFAPETVMNI
jgi:dihydrofolate synthase / folylpolyglutamate synthase